MADRNPDPDPKPKSNGRRCAICHGKYPRVRGAWAGYCGYCVANAKRLIRQARKAEQLPPRVPKLLVPLRVKAGGRVLRKRDGARGEG